MARGDPKGNRPKSGRLSGKFHRLVDEMKLFHRESRHRHKGDDAVSSSKSPPVPGDSNAIVAKRPPSSHNPVSSANLSVQTTITFDEPLNYSYSRTYETSPLLQPTERLCQGLLRRIDHCCHELITRKDSTAMDYAAGSDADKPLRFEIQIDIVRGWSEVWASRNFKSYQKQRLSAEAAKEIILSTHYIIGLFLRHHDDGFVWKDGPVRDDPSQDPETYDHRPGRVQPLSCVPRFFFIEKSQSFESIPGYTLKFSLTNQNQGQKPPEWHRTVEINSTQTSPLNSIGAERLFFKAAYILEELFRVQRQTFEDHHRSCVTSDGCNICRQHDEDGLKLQLHLVNNLGPQFTYMERVVNCKCNLFFQSQAQACLDFVNKVETELLRIRDEADDEINGINDLEFRIIELRGRSWSLDKPLVFTLNPATPYSKRNVEAILDRLQAGVASILQGNAISVRMTAYKRGHFILDKTFVAREPLQPAEHKKLKSPGRPKAYVLDRLRQRIVRDIETICKDTCTLDDAEDEAEPASVAPLTVEKQSEPVQVPDAVTQPDGLNPAPATPRHSPERARVSSSSKPGSPVAEDKAAVEETVNVPVEEHKETTDKPVEEPQKEPARVSAEQPDQETERGHEEEHEREDKGEPGSVQQPSVAITSPDTGARAFPLVSGLTEFGEPKAGGSEGPNEEGTLRPGGYESTNDSRSEQPSDLIYFDTTELGSTEQITVVLPKDEPEPKPGPERDESPTPSLVHGEGPSPDSSLLITPKVSKFNAEVDTSKDKVVDSDAESLGSDTGKRLFKSDSMPSPTLRRVARRSVPSPLHQDDNVHAQSGLGISISPVAAEAEKSQDASAPEHKLGDTATATATGTTPHPEKVDISPQDGKEEAEPPSSGDKPEESPTAQGFAQSKSDFAFSSPRTITPESARDDDEDEEDEEEDRPKPLPGEADPEDVDDFGDLEDVPPSPETRPRSSHGSAGYVGFHEQRFSKINLQIALLRTPPTSSYGGDD
ncbi:hypothetical protein F4779DRAFT_395231 [Xylariaceae sp. FL0662B]|nr:hypothetical protein F4779DRAFT_395231 [Xylariaceae sp. FL0662B]